MRSAIWLTAMFGVGLFLTWSIWISLWEERVITISGWNRWLSRTASTRKPPRNTKLINENHSASGINSGKKFTATAARFLCYTRCSCVYAANLNLHLFNIITTVGSWLQRKRFGTPVFRQLLILCTLHLNIHAPQKVYVYFSRKAALLSPTSCSGKQKTQLQRRFQPLGITNPCFWRLDLFSADQ